MRCGGKTISALYSLQVINVIYHKQVCETWRLTKKKGSIRNLMGRFFKIEYVIFTRYLMLLISEARKIKLIKTQRVYL